MDSCFFLYFNSGASLLLFIRDFTIPFIQLIVVFVFFIKLRAS